MQQLALSPADPEVRGLISHLGEIDPGLPGQSSLTLVPGNGLE